MDFDFSQLSEPLRRALKDLGFEKPTPIQREAIPLALKGYDILEAVLKIPHRDRPPSLKGD